MPSQNLPKPNLPGQGNSKGNPMQPPQLNTKQVSQPGSTTPSQAPQAIFDSSKTDTVSTPSLESNKSQSIPGGNLSRENPGGTPPGIKVSSPELKLEDSSSKQEDNTKANPITSTSQSAKPVPPMMNRQMPKPMPPAPGMKLPNPGSAPIPGQLAKAPSSETSNPVVAQASNSKTNNDTQVKSAPQTQASAAPAQPTNPAQPKQPKGKKKISLPIMIAGGVALILILVLVISQVFGGNNKEETTPTVKEDPGLVETAEPVSLTYWGLWEDSQIISEVINDFEEKNPNVTIDYRKQSHLDYRERLQQAIASGNGPDIFRFHATWGMMIGESLAAMPTDVMTATEYQSTFYPVAYDQLQINGQIVGIPLMYDGLALIYNKEMLKTANLSVPSTWSELRSVANQLTVPSNPSDRSNTNITRGGLAIGNAGNVDHFSDILALLILQNGGDPADPSSKYVSDAVTFYTNFAKQDKVWSDRLPNSTVAFARGEAAMILAPSWRIHDIQNLNPDLDFGVAPVPQLDSANPVAWATYWAEGVSDQSKNKDVAWAFLEYLSSPEVLQKFYADASKIRSFGEIYPRQDMAAELESDELVAAYLEDAPIASSWYMASFTHDNGINDQIIKYYEDAVNSVLSGQNVEKSLETTIEGVDEVLTKYGLQ